jgi:exopolysaccharide production protein ExoZ
MNPTPDRSFVGVQALRGLAAMLVVMYHATQMARARMGGEVELTFGASGVDLFFPISGFVMAMTTYRYWGQAGRAADFMLRRLIRIVPLYWAATLVKIAAVLALPSLTSHPNLDPWHVIASFLFIPAWDADHRPQPVVPVGWTLHFEMLFYVLFAGALWLRLRPVLWLAGGLAVFSFLPLESVLGAVGTLANPILLEFVAGMFIGWACAAGRVLPRGLAAAALVTALVALPLTHLVPAADAFYWRVLLWGVPGALALAGVVALEPVLRSRLGGWPQHLGDASYAIYLVHGFVLPPLGVVLGKLQLTGGPWPLVAVVVACVASALIGMAVHRLVEKPLTAWLGERLRQHRLRQAARSGPDIGRA